MRTVLKGPQLGLALQSLTQALRLLGLAQQRIVQMLRDSGGMSLSSNDYGADTSAEL